VPRSSKDGEIIIDSFAGGGGASVGIEMALGRSPDVAINHDKTAIAMHEVNHPTTEHICQNIWQAIPKDVARGRPVGFAWFSPDCKHFSKAKGSAPVKRNIRDLAWIVVMWAEQVRPRVIVVENVEEFKGWGPVGEGGIPCKLRKGETFDEWVKSLRRAGYKVEWKELRASDYGAPTIRKRLFVIARCDGQPIVWPKPTHYNPKKKFIRRKGLKPWRAVAEVLDWSLPCPSIFMTTAEAKDWRQATGQSVKRPLADATMRRIAQGIKRFVIDAEEPFIVTANHQSNSFRGQGLTEPMKTITAARDAQGLVTPFLTEHANASGQRKWSAEEPLRTQCANVKGGHFALVSPTLVQTGYGERPAEYKCGECHEIFSDKHATGIGTLAPAECPHCGEESNISLVRAGQKPRAPGIEKPLGTIVAGGGKHALVAAFMVKHFGGVVGTTLDNPAPTITTRGTQNQIVAATIERQFGKSAGNDANEPLATITAGGGGKAALVASNLVKLRGTCKDGQPIDEPAPGLTAGGNHVGEVRALLHKYYGAETGQSQSCAEPIHTIPTKERFGLVTVEGQSYQITDIGMRMLSPPELFAAQGFPPSYIIDRKPDGSRITKTAQVSCVGNSVSPPLSEAITRANVPEMAALRRAAE